MFFVLCFVHILPRRITALFRLACEQSISIPSLTWAWLSFTREVPYTFFNLTSERHVKFSRITHALDSNVYRVKAMKKKEEKKTRSNERARYINFNLRYQRWAWNGFTHFEERKKEEDEMVLASPTQFLEFIDEKYISCNNFF